MVYGLSTHPMSCSLSSCTRFAPVHPDHSAGASVRVMLAAALGGAGALGTITTLKACAVQE